MGNILQLQICNAVAAAATVEPLATLRLVQWCAATSDRAGFGWYEHQWFSPLASPADRIVESWFRLHRFTEYRRPTGNKKRYEQLVIICQSVSRLHELVWAPCSGDPRIRVHDDVGPMSRLSV